MRNEPEMMDLILSFAQADERVRCVGMEGSRVNALAPRDIFQDYDVTYLVEEMDSFLADDAWLDRFGKRIILQKPESMTLFPPSLGGWFSYLMLFEDGNRIDLKLVPVADLKRYLAWDGLLTILLDKDRRVADPPIPSDRQYRTAVPTQAEFDDGCNEFWWVSTYVAKGLCRGEPLYAAAHLDRYVRAGLLRMLAWRAAAQRGEPIAAGKCYKCLDQYVDQGTWRALMATFCCDSIAATWRALFGCGDLFRQASTELADLLKFPYPDYDDNVTRYLGGLHQRYSS